MTVDINVPTARAPPPQLLAPAAQLPSCPATLTARLFFFMSTCGYSNNRTGPGASSQTASPGESASPPGNMRPDTREQT